MNKTELTAKPLSAQDKIILEKLKAQAWLTWLKVYPLLFLALIYVYYKVHGRAIRRHSVNLGERQMTDADYQLVYAIFAAFFGTVFLWFAIRDFRRLILPFLRETKANKKDCCSFCAKKYVDPFSGKCLLFYPGKEDIYIEVRKEDFETIGNGEELYLEVASITGEVLFLKSANRVFDSPAEFSFSDR
jgi:hypothetical protein